MLQKIKNFLRQKKELPTLPQNSNFIQTLSLGEWMKELGVSSKYVRDSQLSFELAEKQKEVSQYIQKAKKEKKEAIIRNSIRYSRFIQNKELL